MGHVLAIVYTMLARDVKNLLFFWRCCLGLLFEQLKAAGASVSPLVASLQLVWISVKIFNRPNKAAKYYLVVSLDNI